MISSKTEFLTRDGEHIECAAAEQRVTALAVPVVVHHLHENEHNVLVSKEQRGARSAPLSPT